MRNRRALLAVDGLINLLLGGVLLVFPSSLVSFLGVPAAAPAFYPGILGGVLVGIGIALLLETRSTPLAMSGLGLGGAVAINMCAGVVLAGWLVFGGLTLAARGQVFLWCLVVLLVVLSSAELLQQRRQRGETA